MEKRGNGYVILAVVVFLVFLGVAFILIGFLGPDYENVYEQRISSGALKNPVEGKTVDEAVADFDEDTVKYLLIQMKAYNLHSPPLSKNLPKIEFYIDELVYSAYIEDGEIIVGEGEITKEDIIVRTTKVEVVKMVKDGEYVEESFEKGLSGIELVGSKSLLLGKGYLDMYQDLTGKTITGSAVRFYSN